MYDAYIEAKQVGGSISAISSKSCAHRALICAALSDLPCDIVCSTTSADIEATEGCLDALGASVCRDGQVVHVKPCIGTGLSAAESPSDSAVYLDCRESGTTLRFMLPIAASLSRNVYFVAHGRLTNRPLDALRACLEEHGCTLSEVGVWPMHLQGTMSGGTFSLPGNVSSQFVSALLLALPLCTGAGLVRLEGRVESRPYIDMTIDVMAAFGVDVEEYVEPEASRTSFRISADACYRSCGSFTVEGDWSNAAFWLCAGALSSSGISVYGLDLKSRQGDRAIVDILRRFGADIDCPRDGQQVSVRSSASGLHAIELDVSDIPDLVPIVSVLAGAASGTTRIFGAARLRLKESDRLSTTAEMLRGLGVEVEEKSDALIIEGRARDVPGCSDASAFATMTPCFRPCTLNAHNDHRIAMASSIAALAAVGSVSVLGADCVNKSYPSFFEDYQKLGATIRLSSTQMKG